MYICKYVHMCVLHMRKGKYQKLSPQTRNSNNMSVALEKVQIDPRPDQHTSQSRVQETKKHVEQGVVPHNMQNTHHQ